MIRVADALVSLGVQEWNLNGNPSTEEEFNQAFVKVVGVDEMGSAITSSDPNDFDIAWAEVNARLNELVAGEPLELLRVERNFRLAETDWWANSDLTMTAEQTAYRQALRDITNTYSSLDDVVWPEKP